jgi:gamma-butyrobetaine dioxygenase
MTEGVERIAALFANEGTQEYFGEQVTQAAHMLQAAALAEAAGAPDNLVAAALLHDVGHFRGILSGHDLMAGRDNRHEETGAAWLAQWLPPEVTEPVRLHVPAKRYLCAIDAEYMSKLSEASVYTLGVQGGPMPVDEARAFESLPYAQDAVAVRRWDEAAKDPAAPTPEFDHFRPLLERLVGTRGRRDIVQR